MLFADTYFRGRFVLNMFERDEIRNRGREVKHSQKYVSNKHGSQF